MKCGEIWARSARSSARASRSPCASTSESSSIARHQRRRLGDHARLLQPDPAAAGRRARPACRPAAPGRPAARRSPSAACRPACSQCRRGSTRTRSPAAWPTSASSSSPARWWSRADAVEREQPVAGRRPRRPGAPVSVRRCGAAGRRAARRQAAAQVREHRGRRVHGAVHRRALGVDHPPRPGDEPPARGERRREHHAQHHPQCDVHPAREHRLAQPPFVAPQPPFVAAGDASGERGGCEGPAAGIISRRTFFYWRRESMARRLKATHRSAIDEIDWEGIERSPEFQELVTQAPRRSCSRRRSSS